MNSNTSTSYDYYIQTVTEFKDQQTSIEEQHGSVMKSDALLFTALNKAYELVNIYVRALSCTAENDFSPIPFVQIARKDNTAQIMRMWQKRLSIRHESLDSRMESILHFLIQDSVPTFEETYYGTSYEPTVGYQSARNGLEGVRMFLEYINRIGWGEDRIDVGAIRHGFAKFPSTALAA